MGNKPTLEELAKEHENTLRKWCCKKCGGRLTQVYDQASDKYIVVCGPNRCHPLELRSNTGRNIKEFKEEMGAREVAENYPELAKKEVVKPSKLFPD